jgi:hypothetical protein
MWTTAKALFLIARYFRRIAIALEGIHSLYKLELATKGIFQLDPKIKDEVEFMYGPKSISVDEDSI